MHHFSPIFATLNTNTMKLRSTLLLTLLLGAFAIANAQDNQKFDFKSQPYLQNMNETGVTVMWLANRMCTSYILYGETENPTIKAQASHHGQIDANVPIQKIRLSNLTPGKTYYYRVVSKEIKTYQAYKVVYGDSIVSKVLSFTLPQANRTKFSVLSFNDVHGKSAYIDTVCANNPDFDFALFVGDIVSDIYGEKQILDNLCGSALGRYAGLKPFVYTRGNHETRGPESRILDRYVDTPNGEFYYTFLWGNTCFLVIDGGEDKEDSHPVYGGLSDYDSYRTEQASWVKKVVASKEWRKAEHRIVCSHMPLTLDNGEKWHGPLDLSQKLIPILNEANVDLVIAGHIHRGLIEKPSPTRKYAVVVGGGPVYETGPKKCTTVIKVSIDGKKLKAELLRRDGSLIDTYEK